MVLRREILRSLPPARGIVGRRLGRTNRLDQVISRIDLRGELADPRERLPRAKLDVTAALERVRPIVTDVAQRGSAALREYTQAFDHIDLESARVPVAAIDDAVGSLDPQVRTALEEAIRRARIVHEAQRPRTAATRLGPGAVVTERYVPVDRVGLYVPGGLTVYPSSVVMNAIPAQVAGVGSIAVTSPPYPGTTAPHPVVLAACGLLGIDEVYAAGGAQAIAMLAYGTDECRPVDVVTGPGNVYVAAAKRLVHGVVGIDSEAGPTEVAIIADGTADPDVLAADLIGQAEHDELAACLLVTPDAELLDRVDVALAKQVPATRHSERVAAALGGSQSANVLVDDLEAAITVIDAWAPEHLEVLTRDARAVADRVRNAGAIFVGPWAPVALGDYIAGSNHVLPTGGTARHSGGLSVLSFLRGIHVVDYTRDALAEVAGHIDALGGAEDLLAHVDSVRIRVPRH